MPGPKPTDNRPRSRIGKSRAKDVFKALAKNADGRQAKSKDPKFPGKPPKKQTAVEYWPLDTGSVRPSWGPSPLGYGVDIVIASPDMSGLSNEIQARIEQTAKSLGIPLFAGALPEQPMNEQERRALELAGKIPVTTQPNAAPAPRFPSFMSLGYGYGYDAPRQLTPEEQAKRDLANAQAELTRAKANLKKQDDYLKSLSEAAHTVAIVGEIRGDRMLLIDGGKTIETKLLEGAKVGDYVTCIQETGQPLAVLTGVEPSGQIATVKAVLSDFQVEIESSGVGEGRAIRCMLAVNAGDRVLTDQAQTIVLQNLGKPKSQLAWEQPTNVSWDDIGGHEEAKKALQDAIETPIKHPALFAAYGRRPTKGVLLYGPPGTGKTLLAKASATALARIHGREVAAGFIYVKGPELLSKWVGESESGVRALFKAAKEHKKTHGYPAIVFIDEAESILGKRGDTGRSFMSQTLVPQFLAEMDGLEDSGCMLILATNRAGDLDPAVTREGRIDRKVRVGRPGQEDTGRIAQIHFKNRPTAVEGLATLLGTILHTEPVGAIIGPSGTNPITLSAFSSGAMIAGIVEEAATAALMRDIEAGADAGAVSGITEADLRIGVTKALNGLAALDHSDVFQEILAANPEIFRGGGSPEDHKIALGGPGHGPDLSN